ncbi:Hypothetical predicted protein [Lecanosticta acicola]|uniref:Velvet domain-containing protein n=1 Tax=Lecanosticta acicola TaxID=111012 RepID=A0AAI9EB18_9PEZI|nr:Hypothetical predicted protein [Lecanosticta acicola]
MMAREKTQLIIRQEPQKAQVVQENNPKNRKPVDPPPIIELKYDDRGDPQNSQWLVSPRTFMMVTLINSKEPEDTSVGKYLIGQTVSSLHRLKDITNKDGGFFVFGDISARKLGTYRLRFSLFDTAKDTEEVVFMNSVDSQPFQVMAQRDFGSMSESTHLTRTFSDQGVKLRVRKDNRAISGIGTKRSYNASPPDSSSPSIQSNMYGGAVQDSYSAQTPAAKRQRSGSEYESAHVYQGMPGDHALSPYGGTIPNGTRYGGGIDQQRVQNSYSHHPSNLSMPMMSRQQPMSVQTPSWHSIHSQSALPSPTPSIGNQQQPSYQSATSQSQSSSIFGDPGSASSLPRSYYNNSYPYQSQGQYQGQDTAGDPHAFSDLQLSGSTLPGSGGMSSAPNPGYGHGYLQTGSMYATEPGEVQGAYAYMDPPDQKF